MPKKIETTVTADNLRNIARHATEFGGHLTAIAESMDLDSLAAINVGAYDQARRALAFLDNFVSAARGGLRQARDEAGQFPVVTIAEIVTPINGKRKAKSTK